MDYLNFVNSLKSVVVAPAGYGKTYTIAESLKYVNGKQLILTHTHAGIAAIKEKVSNLKISNSKFHIETISGFAQKYVTAFYMKDDIPLQENSTEYHSFIIEKATELFKMSAIRDVLQVSYKGLFVDEYQDCTKSQHKMISILSAYFPTHLLGDPLQGIFEFSKDDTLVNFDTDINDYTDKFILKTPHRWNNANKLELGKLLDSVRAKLVLREQIDFTNLKADGYYYLNVKETDIYDKNSDYFNWLNKLLQNEKNLKELESLLIIVPTYHKNNEILKGLIHERVKIKNQIDTKHELKLIEAIDDKIFYRCARNIDELIIKISTARKQYKKIVDEVLSLLFNKSLIKEYIKENEFIRKKDLLLNKKSIIIKNALDTFIQFPCLKTLKNILIVLKNGIRFKCPRPELFYTVLKAIDSAEIGFTTVYNAMVSHKNIIRRIGRKIEGKCIGNTFLTKGLEFDTVVILNAHLFDCPKHLYVAMSRCCKKLIVFSEKDIITPCN